MPSAVSDASVLIHLAGIGHLDLLPVFFERVLIPDAVWREVVIQGRSPAVVQSVEAAARTGWLTRQSPNQTAMLRRLRQSLHAGEAEAISLALETAPNVLLLDETDAVPPPAPSVCALRELWESSSKPSRPGTLRPSAHCSANWSKITFISARSSSEKSCNRSAKRESFHTLGLDHRRLTFKYQGLDQKLTGAEEARGYGRFWRKIGIIRTETLSECPSALVRIQLWPVTEERLHLCRRGPPSYNL